MSYRVEPFIREDLELMEPRPRVPLAVTYAYSSGPGITGIENETEKVIACAGIIIPWSGLGELWSCTTPLISKYKLGFLHEGRRLIENTVRLFNLRRVQALVNAKNGKDIDFIRLLGMYPEFANPMEHYGPNGESYYHYVRFF